MLWLRVSFCGVFGAVFLLFLKIDASVFLLVELLVFGVVRDAFKPQPKGLIVDTCDNLQGYPGKAKGFPQECAIPKGAFCAMQHTAEDEGIGGIFFVHAQG